MNDRHLNTLDRLLDGVESALSTLLGHPVAARATPGTDEPEPEMDAAQRRHVAGLMRVNHAGEVCAQALYKGQALWARDAATWTYLQEAASEETDHLAWCGQRLGELDARGSLFNPLWYAGSYLIGAGAALAGDAISYGFVVETERQVEAHLAQHIDRLPPADHRSRAILGKMKTDEARHADNAQARGGVPLKAPVPQLMRLASRFMKAVAYRI